MKIILFSILFLFGIGFAKAQSYAFIDSDYILKNIPEYIEAKEKLDKLSLKWTKEVEDRFAFIKTKRDNFNKEEVLSNGPEQNCLACTCTTGNIIKLKVMTADVAELKTEGFYE